MFPTMTVPLFASPSDLSACQWQFSATLKPQIITFLSFPVFSTCLDMVSDCVGKAVGQYPQCSDCAKFIKCFGSSGNLFSCPNSLFYDVNLGVCQYPIVAVCG